MYERNIFFIDVSRPISRDRRIAYTLRTCYNCIRESEAEYMYILQLRYEAVTLLSCVYQPRYCYCSYRKIKYTGTKKSKKLKAKQQ